MVDLVAGAAYLWHSNDKDSQWEIIPLDQVRSRLKFTVTRDDAYLDNLQKLREEMIETALAGELVAG